MAQPRTMTKSAFAREIGVNKSTVTRMGHAGRLVLDGKGHVLVEASLRRIQDTAGGRPDVAQRHARERGYAVDLQGTAPDTATEDPEATDAPDAIESAAGPPPPAPTQDTAIEAEHAEQERVKYKAEAMHFRNQQIKLDLALEMGQRVPLDKARAEAHALGSLLREEIERVIDQLAPQLTHVDSHIRSGRLEEARHSLRRSLRWELLQAGRRLKDPPK